MKILLWEMHAELFLEVDLNAYTEILNLVMIITISCRTKFLTWFCLVWLVDFHIKVSALNEYIWF